VLALADLGERKQTIGRDVPRSRSLRQPNSSLDRVSRHARLPASSLSPAEEDAGDRREGVLIQLRSSHQLERLTGKRFCLHRVFLVERDCSPTPEREDGHGGQPRPRRRPGHLLEDRLRLGQLAGPPQRLAQEDPRRERPAGLGSGLGREGAAGCCDRPADVTAEQPQPR
jgi:hypothetical protein